MYMCAIVPVSHPHHFIGQTCRQIVVAKVEVVCVCLKQKRVCVRARPMLTSHIVVVVIVPFLH